MTTPTQNKFKSTTIYGNFINDDYQDGSVLANAQFKNITTSANISLNGVSDVSVLNNTITTVTTSQKLLGDIICEGGNITLNSYTKNVLTKNLSGTTLSNVNSQVGGVLNCQTINNYGHMNNWKGGNLKLYDTGNTIHSLIYTSSGTLHIRTYNVATYPVLFYCTKLQHSPNNGVNTYDVITSQTISTSLSPYALLASPSFSGLPTVPTPTLTDSSTQIATTAFVKNQGYLTSVSTAYAPTTNPANGQNNYASVSAIAATYQTITGMSSYLTKAAMSTYAPLVSPSFTGNIIGSDWILTKQAEFSDGIIELGKVGNSISRIDMKSTNGDYDVRIYQQNGNSTLAGQGQLVIEAGGGVNFTSMPFTSIVPTTANHLCNKTYVDSILANGSLNNQYSKCKIIV